MNPCDRRLSPWDYFRFGIFFMPIIPMIGAIGIVIGTIKVWLQRYDEIIKNPINRILGLYSLCLILNCCFARNQGAAFLGLFNFLPFFCFFAAINITIKTQFQLIELAKIILLSSIPIHLLGLVQMIFHFELQFNLFASNFPLKYYSEDRVRSIFDNANIFGFYTIKTLVMTLICVDQLHQELQKFNFKKNFWIMPSNIILNPKFSIKFILAISALILNLVSATISLSRVVLITALLICIGYYAYKKWILLTSLMTTFTMMILCSGYLNNPLGQICRQILPSISWSRLHQPYSPNTPVELLRPTIWKLAAQLTGERPITGWGLRSFSELFQERLHQEIGHQHNIFLMLSSDIGIPLTLFFVGILIMVIEGGISTLRSNQFNQNLDGTKNDISSFRTIYYLYLLSAGGWIAVNMVDVTVFNLVLNSFTWLIFGSIAGISDRKGIETK